MNLEPVRHESYTIGQDSGIPSLRLAITGKCNLRCAYCPVAGDSYVLRSDHVLSAEAFSHITELAYEVGFRHFSITGGEPLAAPKKTFALAQTIQQFDDLGYLRLNTNGHLLKHYASHIVEAGFHKIKVSIDSLQTGKFEDANLQKESPESLSVVREGLSIMQHHGLSIRVNMVVGVYNQQEVPDMIAFCAEHDFELKLFDVTYYKDALSTNSRFWEENFVSLASLSQELEQEFGSPIIVYAVGGFGNPMPVFKPFSNSPIRLRMSDVAARYRPECEGCLDYICQDGFCNVTITAEGGIKPCRPEGLDFDLGLTDSHGNLLSDSVIQNKLASTIELFRGTVEHQRSLQDMIKSWQSRIPS